ncbi:MAG: tRNA uridine-5-carboxymethylaminomethyl(34) synthesis GTPase MnmE [Lachnospiraceae bacterium]|nr:tRNA uridine-5-carboxymethylaminomethyl(34) synthesis GTPase MnmE [Lachnospiraceae bacterium]
MKTDTIAAIASGLTHAGIGIIRISGPEAIAVADRVVHIKGKKLQDVSTHTVNYGFVYDGENKLDEAIILVMRAPHSFTAEDTVEIQCHGGPWVMKCILESVVHHGARLAEPGEFTRRAFLNGRIDLSQAEAVMGMIQAQNDYARDASLKQLQGNISRKIRELREQLLHEMAYIEAALDDPEHISLEGYTEKIDEKLDNLLIQIQELIRTAENGKILTEGIRTVILGRPNAGKSSLLNRLLGEERAIVTDIAGTTRDTLEERIQLGGFTLRLIDTAGIHSTENPIEKIGVERAREQARQADLLLYVVDSSQKLEKSDQEILELLQGRRSLILLNKMDLPSVIEKEDLEKRTGQPVLSLSAREGTGIDELKTAIENLFDLGEIGKNQQVTITNMRHKEALEEAENSLLLVKQSVEAGMPEDLYTIDLMNAYESLGRIVGEAVEDDLVDKIFREFCMGK